MREIPQLEQALNIADQASLSAEELEKIHRQEMFWEDIAFLGLMRYSSSSGKTSCEYFRL